MKVPSVSDQRHGPLKINSPKEIGAKTVTLATATSSPYSFSLWLLCLLQLVLLFQLTSPAAAPHSPTPPTPAPHPSSILLRLGPLLLLLFLNNFIQGISRLHMIFQYS